MELLKVADSWCCMAGISDTDRWRVDWLGTVLLVERLNRDSEPGTRDRARHVHQREMP